MPDNLDPENLVDAAGIAERLGTHRQTVHLWRRRHPDFPQPVARLRIGMVWAWPDVERWARSTGRLANPEEREA